MSSHATYTRAKHPSICLGAQRGPSSRTKAPNRICRVRSKGSRGRDAVDAQFFTQVMFCTLSLKKSSNVNMRSSDVCNGHNPSSSLEKLSFCWNGFCARDCFRPSETKWRQLPCPFSEALETGPPLSLLCNRRAFHFVNRTSVLLPISSRFNLAIGWALT